MTTAWMPSPTTHVYLRDTVRMLWIRNNNRVFSMRTKISAILNDAADRLEKRAGTSTHQKLIVDELVAIVLGTVGDKSRLRRMLDTALDAAKAIERTYLTGTPPVISVVLERLEVISSILKKFTDDIEKHPARSDMRQDPHPDL